MSQIKAIEDSLKEMRNTLRNHPLYNNIQEIADVRIFMESHVYAVWDFMSLLKALQQDLTTVKVPWTPSKQPILARFINEIVHGEESDLNELGQPMSHFEMYVQAMQTMGADTHEIEQFIQRISANTPLDEALDSCAINAETKDFVRFTFSIIQRGKIHEIASLFTLGREDLIPEMFIEMVKELKANHPTQMADFLYYLERHIEVDGEDHGPLSLKLMDEVCENDPVKWEEATRVAEEALSMRIRLWDGVVRKNNALSGALV